MKNIELPQAYLVEVAETVRLLGHPERLRIVEFLNRHGRRSVSEIVEGIGGRQAAVSQHLTQMRRAGVLASDRAGRNVRYAVKAQSALTLLNCIRREYLKVKN